MAWPPLRKGLLTEKEAAEYVGLSPRTLQRKRLARTGDGPSWVQATKTRVGYRKRTLDAWLARQNRPTA